MSAEAPVLDGPASSARADEERASIVAPGQAALYDWRGIYKGAPFTLDFVARADVEAGAAALGAVAARGGMPVMDTDQPGSPSVAELMQRNGDDFPAPLIRLFVALKLTTLAQGFSGVRWEVIETLSACLAGNVLPAIPVNVPSDRFALAYLFGTLTGAGDLLAGDASRSAASALKEAGRAPLKLTDTEKRALLSGSELSIALALSGLFEAECLLQSALVAEALALARSGIAGLAVGPAGPRLFRRRGRSQVADFLNALSASGAAAPSAPAPAPAVAIDGAARVVAQAGALLEMLQQAGEILQREANEPSEDVMIVWQTEAVFRVAADGNAVSLASDMVARALAEIGRMAERRVASLAAAADASSAAHTVDMASTFAAQIRERVAADGSAQSPRDDAAAGLRGAERLRPLAGTVALVVAIAALAGARSEDGTGGAALDAVRRLLLGATPASDDERDDLSASKVAAAADLVRSGALAAASGAKPPSVEVLVKARPWERRVG